LSTILCFDSIQDTPWYFDFAVFFSQYLMKNWLRAVNEGQ